jgi:hypothetical protein
MEYLSAICFEKTGGVGVLQEFGEVDWNSG